METEDEVPDGDYGCLIILEQEIGYAFSVKSISNLIFLDWHHIPGLNEEQERCRLWMVQNKENLLRIAALHQKIEVVKFLLECGLDPNTAVEVAVEQYDDAMLLLLLEADADFPQNIASFLNFYGYAFSVGIQENAKKGIQDLIKNRDRLHNLIEEGNLTLENSFELGLKKGGKLLNRHNRSALFTALCCRKFDIFITLQYYGAEFKDEKERKEVIESLNDEEKTLLQNALLQTFRSVENAHIYYLISKSRSRDEKPQLYTELKKYYDKLNEVPELLHILKVVQYAGNLDIIFDFDKIDTSRICPISCPPSPENILLGITYYQERKIYLGAQASENITLGTLIHELTHLAMEIVYNNNCNPYPRDDKNGRKNGVKVDLEQCENMLKEEATETLGEAPEIFKQVKNYEEKYWHSEFIARTSEILLELENGKKKLEESDLGQILKYVHQGKIREDCENFIRSSILMMGQSYQYISFLQCQTMEHFKAFRMSNIFLTNPELINDNSSRIENLKLPQKMKEKRDDRSSSSHSDEISSENKRILIYKVQSTKLGMLKLTQRIFDASPQKSHENHFILKLEYFLYSQRDVEEIYKKKNNKIIFEIPFHEDCVNVLKDGIIMKICEFASTIPNQIEFVVHKDVAVFLKRGLKILGLQQQIEEISDDKLTLYHFDLKSREIILEKKTYFQGKEIALKELVAVDDDDILKKIKPDFIEDLLKGKKPKIGGELQKVDDLEYSDVFLEVNFESLKNAFKEENNLFIIENKMMKKDENDEEIEGDKEDEEDEEYEDDDIIEYFKKCIQEDKIYPADLKKMKKLDHRLLIVNHFSETDFPTFCHYNAERKIYWIKIKHLRSNSFMLQKLYNPYFYIERRVRKPVTEMPNTEKTAESPREESMSAENDGKNSNKHIKMVLAKEKDFIADIVNQKILIIADDPGIGKSTTLTHLYADPLIQDKHWVIKHIKMVLAKEKDFIADIVNQKILIIADDPGMGKSTTLTHLYADPLIQDKHWVIRINLITHAAVFERKIRLDGNPTLTVKTIISCLREIEPCLRTEANAAILESLFLRNNKKSLLLAFDGFDEILGEKRRDNIITIFKFLKDKTLCKLWVTTRLHYKKDLENKLNTLSVQLEPLDEEGKKNFIKKYFQERLKLVLKPETHSEVFCDEGWQISLYAETLLIKMKEIFVDVEKFMGTPLQLNLILSGSHEHFMNWLGTNNKEKPFPDFSYLGENILEVYQAFIERKYEIYFKKIGQPQTDLQKLPRHATNRYHGNLATSWLFDRKSLEPKENIKEMVLSLGLVQTRDYKNFEFIHFTFREFYCADKVLSYFTDRFHNPTLPFKPSHKSKLDKFRIIFSYMSFMSFDQVICKFINIGLQQFKNFNIPEEIYKEIGNALEDTIAVYTAAKKGCEHVFSLIFSCYKRVLTEIPSTGENLTFFQDLKTFPFNLKDYGRYDHSRFGVTAFLVQLREPLELEPLLNWIVQGGKKILEVLFKELKTLPPNDREVILLTEYAEPTYWIRAKPHGILNVTLTHKMFELFEFINEEAKIILGQDGHRKLLKKTNEYSETILNQAIACQNTEIIRYLLHEGTNSLSKKEYKHFILRKNAFDEDSFHKAFLLKDLNTAKLLAEKMKEVLSAEEFEDYIIQVANIRSVLKERKPKDLILHLSKKYEILNFLLQSIHYFQDKNKWITLQLKDNKEGQDKLISVLYHHHPEEIETEIKNITEITSSAEFEKRISIRDDVGRTILHVAALDDRLFQDYFEGTRKNRYGDFSGMNIKKNEDRIKELELMKILLKKATELLSKDQYYAFLSAQDRSGKTALHLSAYNQNHKTAELILTKAEQFLNEEEFKKLITMQDEKDRNVLHYAAYCGAPTIREMVLSLLLKARKILSKSEYYIFLTALDEENNFPLQVIGEIIRDPFSEFICSGYCQIFPGITYAVIEHFFDFIENQEETEVGPLPLAEKYCMLETLQMYIAENS